MSQGFPRLLGDIGGTNARWAWQPSIGAPIQDLIVSPCKQSASLYDSAQSYIDQHGTGAPLCASIGIAAAVTGDQVQLTNNGWSFSISKLKQSLGLERCLVINDFTALAMSLPALGNADRRAIGENKASKSIEAHDFPIALIGPGTGLGVSGLIPSRRQNATVWSAIAGEGGHVTLAPSNDRECDLLSVLRAEQAHVSAEDLLSGPGLVKLYKTLCRLDGLLAKRLEPEQITQAAIDRSDEGCVSAVRMFSALLGSVAGNLALTLGARGGVYIGGGIVPRMGAAFDEATFRKRFESKGRFKDYLQPIPTWLITAPASALVGASRALDVLPME